MRKFGQLAVDQWGQDHLVRLWTVGESFLREG
jgi:hypothetical protein